VRRQPHSNKMKLLRFLARQKGAGLPERQYREDERGTREYLVLNKEGKPEPQRFSRQVALGPSIRHLYKLLKKEYRHMQRTGNIARRNHVTVTNA